MSAAARSIYLFSFYMLTVGLGLMFVPNLVLGLLGLPATSEVWIRIGGAILLFQGSYYFRAARANLHLFIGWTVTARLLISAFLVGLVLAQLGPRMLVVFAAVDTVGALWTRFELRKTSEGIARTRDA